MAEVNLKVAEILCFFTYRHLQQGPLRDVSRRFAELAHSINVEVASSEEKLAGLRKLLEAKDCMVRAKVQENRENG